VKKIAVLNKILWLAIGIIVIEISFGDAFSTNRLYAQHTSIKSRQANSAPHYYTFGVVPQLEQRKIFHIWRPILNEIELRTNIKIKMVGTAKIPDFTRKFLQGKFDFAYMNPYHMMQSVDTQGYIPLVRDGGRNLQGIIVVHKDSNIFTISELQNLKFAFPSANALGASLLIKHQLEKQNINFQPNYVQTHSSVYLHVAKKLYPVGGGVLSTLLAQKKHIRDSLRVIYQSPPVPPHPISAHPRVSEEIRLKVKKAFLEMSKSKHFNEYLKKIPIKKMIPANIADYMKLRDLHLERHYITEIIE
jgi:phosphonate transport system substrate-binding protein